MSVQVGLDNFLKMNEIRRRASGSGRRSLRAASRS